MSLLTAAEPIDRLRYQAVLVFDYFDTAKAGRLTADQVQAFFTWSSRKVGYNFNSWMSPTPAGHALMQWSCQSHVCHGVTAEGRECGQSVIVRVWTGWENVSTVRPQRQLFLCKNAPVEQLRQACIAGSSQAPSQLTLPFCVGSTVILTEVYSTA